MVSTISTLPSASPRSGPKLILGVDGRDGVLVPLPLLISSPPEGIPAESGTAGAPFLVAIPLGFRPEVIISDWTLRGGGGVFIDEGRPLPNPICRAPGAGEVLEFECEFEFEFEEPSSEPFQGK